ncbi:MAG: nucleotidyltransferase family protein [Acidobacteria bacterium]|nr:nucleotidyltransferase family protein [Acidobacteriota bacterium]
MTMELLRTGKRAGILEAARRNGAGNVRVFGSVARGQAGPESDVDFLVDLEPGRNLFDLGGLLEDLRELLECPVHVVDARMLHPPIRDQVLAEAVPLETAPN